MGLFEKGTELKIEFEESSIHKEQVACRVLDVEGDIILLDSSEISPYYFQYLYEGREIKLFLYDMHGINIFDSIIMTAPTDGKFEVELPVNYDSIQRRQYVRAAIELNLVLQRENQKITAKTIDIGGNGIRFITEDRLKFGDKFDITLFLPGTNTVTTKAAVLKVVDKNKGEYVIEFIDLKEVFRDRIIKLCLNIQSKIIKDRKNSII